MKKVVPLPYLWNRCFTNTPYSSDKAALTVNGAVYLIEKNKLCIPDYTSLKNYIQSNLIATKPSYVLTEDYNMLHSAVQGESDKKLMKHILSTCGRRHLYGKSKMVAQPGKKPIASITKARFFTCLVDL